MSGVHWLQIDLGKIMCLIENCFTKNLYHQTVFQITVAVFFFVTKKRNVKENEYGMLP